jgi:hypothetical protein
MRKSHSKTPFFQGMNKTLFGSPPIAELARMERARAKLDSLCFNQLNLLFGSFIPAFLLNVLSPSGANSRRRIFTPAVTFWAFLGQVLDPDAPCRKALAHVQVLFASQGLTLPSCDTGAYCKARLRLPVPWLYKILDFVVNRLTGTQEARTLLVDGTGIVLPDTPKNQRRFPQSRSQKKGCGFPAMKLVGLFDLKTGAWIAVARGNKHVSEIRLFRRLFRHLRPGDTVVADRGFCSYGTICEMMDRGIDVILRNHQARKTDYRKGTRLGKRDHLILIERTKGKAYAHLPEELVVREVSVSQSRPGYRTKSVILLTTILGVDEMTRDQLGHIYLQRWRVELFFDDIKTTMNMEMLRTQSPEMIYRELLMHMIAYNLVRVFIVRSDADSERTSFKGTVDRLEVWREAIWWAVGTAKAARLVDGLMETVAEDEVPHRPGRLEPRVKKRRPKPYQNLTKPRHQMREIPHRNAYKKVA